MFDRSSLGHVMRAGCIASASQLNRGIGWNPATNEITFDGNGFLWAADHAAWVFDGDFMIELPGVAFSSIASAMCLISQWRSATGGRSFRLDYRGELSPKRFRAFLSIDGTAHTDIDANFTAVANTPYDVALNRIGTTVRIFSGAAGGAIPMIGSGTVSGALRDSPHQMIIGAYGTGTANEVATGMLSGRMGGIPRITNGSGRGAEDSGHTLDFWPSGAWPTS